MARKKAEQATASFLVTEAELRTAVCVPAIRSEVEQWRANAAYPKVTETTRTLLNHWFHTDHRLPDRRTFRYHESQRFAVETLVYLYEVAGISNQAQLYQRYVQAGQNPRLPKYDLYSRFGVKMATGSGKTKVMSLAVAWHYLNARLETENPHPATFLIVAPNVIVFERLQHDFRNGAIFRADPVIPPALQTFWDMECYVRGEGKRAHSSGALYLTNVQQLYERNGGDGGNPDPMTAVLGANPRKGETTGGGDDFLERIVKRNDLVLVLNDEAHHTWNEENEWMRAIRRLHGRAPLVGQIDFSATPRFQDGKLFPWTVSDYPLANAIRDGIVKRPLKGVITAAEAQSDYAPTRYGAYLVAGVERWKEYRDQLAAVGKKPILFLMLNSTQEVDEVVEWLRKQYPAEFAGEKTLPIHVNLRAGEDESGGILGKDLAAARKFAEDAGKDESPVNAVVSVLMLREGWDVENVTVVVGLRPYSAKADILPEQTIGRGLRLMFRGQEGYEERVDIIGNKAFLDFVDELERLEGVSFQTFDPTREKLTITTIEPVPGRELFDIGIPELSRVVTRRQDLGEVIGALDVSVLAIQPLAPVNSSPGEKMTFEGYDILTGDLEVERAYEPPQPQTPQEVIAYYAEAITRRIKAPGHFAAVAVKLREFFDTRAFGGPADLNEPGFLPAMTSKRAATEIPDLFVRALQPHLLEERAPIVYAPARSLYTTPAFPWSRPTYEARHSIFNYEGCDNQFEAEFASWLDHADDCRALCKLPRQFSFAIEYADAAGNLRLYYPDFVAVGKDGQHWLIETKGQEDANVTLKDRAAELWCRNCTELALGTWHYVKVLQKEFQRIQPATLEDLRLFKRASLPGLA